MLINQIVKMFCLSHHLQNNYQKKQVERLERGPQPPPSKQRRKVRPSALTRPPKKGKKRKRLLRLIGSGDRTDSAVRTKNGAGAAAAADRSLANCLDLPSDVVVEKRKGKITLRHLCGFKYVVRTVRLFHTKAAMF